METSGMLVRNFCFDPQEVLKTPRFKLFAPPKRNQKRQEKDTHVSCSLVRVCM